MRIVSRAAAALVALGLLVGGLLVVVEIVTQVWRHRPWIIPYDDWYRSGVTDPWSSQPARWVCLALVAGGIALLVVVFARRKPGSLPLDETADVQRASLERALARAADGVDGVERASVRVSGSSVEVAVKTSRHEPGDLGERVDAAVAERIATVGLPEAPTVSVAVKQAARQ